MNEYLKALNEIKVNRTIEKLKANNMDASYAQTKEDAYAIAISLLNEGDIVACGGSATLAQVGISQYLLDNMGKYQYLYRNPSFTKEESVEIMRKALLSDVYFTSSNAITENGELVNIDGNGNRVAAMIYGPKKVVVIAGVNKITKDIDSAYRRIKEVCAPANTIRLNLDTPCSKTGQCVNCKSPARVCCEIVIHQQQRQKGRIHVILVGENLGF